MTASELRELAEDLREKYWPCADGPNRFEQAAEVLELVAWAEEKRVDIEWADYKWWIGCIETGDTIIGTLRRAKGASRG